MGLFEFFGDKAERAPQIAFFHVAHDENDPGSAIVGRPVRQKRRGVPNVLDAVDHKGSLDLLQVDQALYAQHLGTIQHHQKL